MTILLKEPWDVYHAARQTHVGSHDLAIFAENPRTYRQKQLGLLPGRGSASMHLGTMVHTMVLEGADVFDERYKLAPAGADNPRTKAYREWRDTLGEGVEPITEAQLYDVGLMDAAVRSHEAARDILSRPGQCEGVVRAEIKGILCQSRLDWFVAPETEANRGIIADLKTTRDIDAFVQQARDYGYIDQLAFYRLIVRESHGLNPACFLIVVETKAPFTPAVYRVCDSALDAAEARILERLAAMRDAIDTDHWPNAYAGVRLLTDETETA